LRDFLINRARSFIFSTAPLPAAAAAATAAVELLGSSEGERLLGRLWNGLNQFAGSCGKIPSSAIFPFIIGGESEAMAAAQAFSEEGFLVPAIRFPTVARNSARLRVVVTAAHELADLLALANRLRLRSAGDEGSSGACGA